MVHDGRLEKLGSDRSGSSSSNEEADGARSQETKVGKLLCSLLGPLGPGFAEQCHPLWRSVSLSQLVLPGNPLMDPPRGLSSLT